LTCSPSAPQVNLDEHANLAREHLDGVVSIDQYSQAPYC
jgi:hypothetical protein